MCCRPLETILTQQSLRVPSRNICLSPLLQILLGDEAALVSLNHGLSKLDVGGNGCRSRGLPCLFRHDGSSKGNVVDPIGLSNNSWRAKLASIVLEKSPASSIGSLGVVTAPHCSDGAIVVKGKKLDPLLDFSPFSSLLEGGRGGGRICFD